MKQVLVLNRRGVVGTILITDLVGLDVVKDGAWVNLGGSVHTGGINATIDAGWRRVFAVDKHRNKIELFERVRCTWGILTGTTRGTVIRFLDRGGVVIRSSSGQEAHVFRPERDLEVIWPRMRG